MVRSLLATQAARLVLQPGKETPPARVPGYTSGKRQAELLIQNSRAAVTILRLPSLFGPPSKGGPAHRRRGAGHDQASQSDRSYQINNVEYSGRFSLDRVLDQLRQVVVLNDAPGVWDGSDSDARDVQRTAADLVGTRRGDFERGRR